LRLNRKIPSKNFSYLSKLPLQTLTIANLPRDLRDLKSKSLTNLSVYSISTNIREDDIKALGNFSLQSLLLYGNEFRTSLRFERMSLTRLSLPDCALQDRDVTFFGDIPLRHLDLSGNRKISSRIFLLLKPLTHLRILNVGSCQLTGLDGIDYLAIENLILSNNLINNRALFVLSKMSTLKFLEMRWCQKITSQGLKPFVNLKTLRFIDLSYCKNIALEELAFLSHLTIAVKPKESLIATPT